MIVRYEIIEVVRDDITEELLEKVGEATKIRLAELYGDSLVFDPVFVERKFDFDGEDYMHVYIVFEGDENVFRAKWDVGVEWLIGPDLDKLGVKKVVSHSISKKSEWDELIAEGTREA